MKKEYRCERQIRLYKMPATKGSTGNKRSKLLMENELNDTAMIRLYYVAFYAINALLAINGFNPKTLSGT